MPASQRAKRAWLLVDVRQQNMTPRKPNRELSELRNLGPTIVRRLSEIGIHSENDLRRIGPAQAYLLIQKHEERKLPVCYYLYSLAGALENKHWNDIPEKQKKNLRREIGLDAHKPK